MLRLRGAQSKNANLATKVIPLANFVGDASPHLHPLTRKGWRSAVCVESWHRDANLRFRHQYQK